MGKTVVGKGGSGVGLFEGSTGEAVGKGSGVGLFVDGDKVGFFDGFGELSTGAFTIAGVSEATGAAFSIAGVALLGGGVGSDDG